jgi:hypothetical protein
MPLMVVTYSLTTIVTPSETVVDFASSGIESARLLCGSEVEEREDRVLRSPDVTDDPVTVGKVVESSIVVQGANKVC